METAEGRTKLAHIAVHVHICNFHYTLETVEKATSIPYRNLALSSCFI